MRRAFLLVIAGLSLSACQDLAEQPRVDTYSETEAFDGNMAARDLPKGVVAFAATDEEAQPEAFDRSTVELGRQDFHSFCVPCHGTSGRGDGIVVQRGFPPPPSFLIERLQQAPAQHYFDVITNGHGIMYSYADRVPSEDRWAIIAYIRALQLAQAPAEDGGGRR